MEAELFIRSDNVLGEGPVWDAIRKELLWVDIERNLLCFYEFKNGAILQVETDSKIGAAVPVDGSNEYILALQSGLKIYDRDTGIVQPIVNPEKNLKRNRFNDGKCDPAGRFWIGSMDVLAQKKTGSLYVLDNQLSLSKKISGIGISNGMAWSPDHTKMYFIDTKTYQVVRFDYSIESGAIENPQAVINVPKKQGAPDGICIDAEGMLWIAHWGGGNVSRWNPFTGELLQKFDVPAPHVTSCCFGGINLDTLFITTAKQGISEEQQKQFPLSGSVFHIKPGVKGCTSSYFKLNTN